MREKESATFFVLVTVCPKPAYISDLNKVFALKKSQYGIKSAPALCNDSCRCPTKLQGFCVSLPGCLQIWQGQGWAGHAEIVSVYVGPTERGLDFLIDLLI